LDHFQSQILPAWKDTPLDDVKAVAVEKWVRGIGDLAPGSKAKIRNHMSALFLTASGIELYTKLNPIASVRQSAVCQREPDILTLDEIRPVTLPYLQIAGSSEILPLLVVYPRFQTVHGWVWCFAVGCA
jgi:hypothetical protein